MACSLSKLEQPEKASIAAARAKLAASCASRRSCAQAKQAGRQAKARQALEARLDRGSQVNTLFPRASD